MPTLFERVRPDTGRITIPPPGSIPPKQRFERPVTVNFDDVPDCTAIDTRYSGLAFASLLVNPARRAPAYARRLEFTDQAAAKNVLSINATPGLCAPFFNEAAGCVEVRFEQLQRALTVQAFAFTTPGVMTHDDNRPYIEAFDDAGQRLGRVRTPYGPADAAAFDCHWYPLTFNSPTRNIRSLRMSAEARGSQGVHAVFDALTYTFMLP